ncbi:MAG: hypothetical protein ACETWB_01680 [Anaerolineae bacterium]
MKRAAQVAIACLLAFLATYGGGAQTPEVRYFPQTGHNVRGEFLKFFETWGGVELFGYPLTEEFIKDGVRVQCFQKVRMEWHPQNPKPYQVELGLLGELLGYRQPPIPSSEIPPADDPLRRYYPETGHTVSFAFLKYFDEHGGLDIFGYPITELLVEQGIIVQYFQRAGMEWHEDDPSSPVQLTPLGELYIQKIGLDPSLLEPVQIQAMPTSTPLTTPQREAPELNIMASVKYAITGRGSDEQIVYVYVTDEEGQNVEGVEVRLIARYPTEDRHFAPPPTDAHGYTQHTFPIGDPLPGYIIVIDAIASYEGQAAATQTFFLPWW